MHWQETGRQEKWEIFNPSFSVLGDVSGRQRFSSFFQSWPTGDTIVQVPLNSSNTLVPSVPPALGMAPASIYICVLMSMLPHYHPLCFSDYFLTDSGVLELHHEDFEKDAKEFAFYALMLGTLS